MKLMFSELSPAVSSYLERWASGFALTLTLSWAGCAGMPEARVNAMPIPNAEVEAPEEVEQKKPAKQRAANPTRQAAEHLPATTSHLLTATDIRAFHAGAILSDQTYAEVNSLWLHEFYPRFRAELFRQGVVHWDDRFNCKHFAGFYTEMAQSRYFAETFHRTAPARTLALGQIWYIRDNGQGAHAIVVAFTERGRLYIEPQTGQEVRLSVKEQASIYVAEL